MELKGKQLVLNRDELSDVLSEVSDDPVDIGRIINFVSRAFMLQNDIHRPAYVFEVEDGVSKDDVEYLNKAMTELGVCAVLVPKGALQYVCTLTPESMDVKNLKTIVWGLDAGRKKE